MMTNRRNSGEPCDKELITAKNVVINMEWGAFGDNGELDYFRTIFDEALDKESIVPCKQK